MKRCAETGVGLGAGLGVGRGLGLGALLLAGLLGACTAPAPYRDTHLPPPHKAEQPAAPAEAPKGDAETRFQAALKLMKDHQPQEARAAFASLAQDFPQYSGPLNDLGVLQAQGRQRELAIASFAKAVAADEHNAFAWNWLGILYRESGDYARAEQAYRKAIEVKPDDAAAHFNLGILYDAYLGRPAEALAQYREYQRVAGTGNLMVGVWIRQLELRLKPTSLAASSTMGAMP
jgi:tetratricopeptide (TPR) repeat protein